MVPTDPEEAFYTEFYTLLGQLQKHEITPRQFFLRLTRKKDSACILLDIGADYGFSEWVQLKRTARRKLRCESGLEETTLPGIIFWVGLAKNGRLRITKTEARGVTAIGAVARRKIAKKTLKAILKIVPPAPSG